jgi:hypothetical protein
MLCDNLHAYVGHTIDGESLDFMVEWLLNDSDPLAVAVHDELRDFICERARPGCDEAAVDLGVQKFAVRAR